MWFIPLCLLLSGGVLLSGCSLLGPPRSVTQPEGVHITREIPFASVGSRKLCLDLYRSEAASEVQPCLVWLYGGGWLRGDKDPLPIAPLAQRGFTLASIDYRLSDEAIFPAQIHDVKAAMRWLRANAGQLGIDPQRIGVIGGSAGGHLAALAGTAGPEVPGLEGGLGVTGVSSRPDCVVALFPATDLARLDMAETHVDWRIRVAVRKMLGNVRTIDSAAAAAASPITWVDAQDPPLLLVHGDRDFLIDRDQSDLMHAAVTRAGGSSRLVIIPGAGHGNRMLARPDVQAAIGGFLDEQLGKPRR